MNLGLTASAVQRALVLILTVEEHFSVLARAELIGLLKGLALSSRRTAERDAD